MPEFLIRIDPRSSFQQRDFETTLRESHAGPPSACAGSHDNRVKFLHSP
jgi:hypothetical protein